MFKASLLGLTATSAVALGEGDKPNIIYFLCDDQDQDQGGGFPLVGWDGTQGVVTPLPRTHANLVSKGTTALNMYVHTPVCNPSRSELLSGRYLHNIKIVKGIARDMGANSTYASDHNFAQDLQKAGYQTALFGKYLNHMPTVFPIPGWDLFMGYDGSSYTHFHFHTYGVPAAVHPNMPDGVWHSSADKNSPDYITSIIGNASVKWFEYTKHVVPDAPFFAYIASKAPHGPATPAPWYEGYFNETWPTGPQRRANWNLPKEARKNHHAYVATNPQYADSDVNHVDDLFLRRWVTLLSVDDTIHEVIMKLEEMQIDNSSYVLYSSDHGYNQGQLQLPAGKRNPYEWDTKVFLVVRGPGIKVGSTFAQPATQVDLAPTFLGLAGMQQKEGHAYDGEELRDGKSLVPFIVNDPSNALPSTRRHIASLPSNYAATWRSSLIHEYFFAHQYAESTFKPLPPSRWDSCSWWDSRFCHDTDANNWRQIRFFDGAPKGLVNVTYAEFHYGDIMLHDINFSAQPYITEIFNLTTDADQIHNIAFGQNGMSDSMKAALSAELLQRTACKGIECI